MVPARRGSPAAQHLCRSCASQQQPQAWTHAAHNHSCCAQDVCTSGAPSPSPCPARVLAATALTLRGLLQNERASRVAIVNAVGFHVEVYCALLWSLQQAGNNVTLYVEPKQTHDIQAVIHSWSEPSLGHQLRHFCALIAEALCHRYDKPFRSHTEIEADACQYAAIAFSTWPEQHTLLMFALLSKQCPGQKYILLVHNPDTLLDPPPGACLLPCVPRSSESTLQLQSPGKQVHMHGDRTPRHLQMAPKLAARSLAVPNGLRCAQETPGQPAC